MYEIQTNIQPNAELIFYSKLVHMCMYGIQTNILLNAELIFHFKIVHMCMYEIQTNIPLNAYIHIPHHTHSGVRMSQNFS